MRTYRTGFIAAIVGNILLVVVVLGLWVHYRVGSTPRAAETNAATPQPPDSSPSSSSHSAAPETETPLAPIQLSPGRLQSIGVRTGKVQQKNVEDEIRTTGNVAVDETRLAYVQVRFSGYIQKVFADATYQYVRKGQPLFTVYSPELVAAEREYLVAKETQARMASIADPSVAADSTSLVEAAAS